MPEGTARSAGAGAGVDLSTSTSTSTSEPEADATGPDDPDGPRGLDVPDGPDGPVRAAAHVGPAAAPPRGRLAGRRGTVDAVLRRSPAQPLFRLAVLAYHGIDDPRTFALQMDRLVRVARPVSLARVEQAVTSGRPLPHRSVLVTFDDGDHTVLTEGLPVLAELRQSARAGAPRQEQLTRRDLLTLRRSGVAIGNHTAGHPCLDHCDDDTVRDEITRAHRDLTGWLEGEEPTAFAYPNGNVDHRADPVLRRLGYRTGFLFDHRHDRLMPRRPLRISRLRVNSTTGRDRFDTILSGLHPAVHRLRGGPGRARFPPVPRRPAPLRPQARR
ncbi:polysaccharide deacetylase family protein [Kitasatospora sp. NPDC056181]|uniref:polysaccharide deacetylase family protein n=1 Tax=Kitasatospora sp. NPDC056181 TaxID=3345737 RepID=UPI0035D85B36